MRNEKINNRIFFPGAEVNQSADIYVYLRSSSAFVRSFILVLFAVKNDPIQKASVFSLFSTITWHIVYSHIQYCQQSRPLARVRYHIVLSDIEECRLLDLSSISMGA